MRSFSCSDCSELLLEAGHEAGMAGIVRLSLRVGQWRFARTELIGTIHEPAAYFALSA